jgi:hypothetical protein
MTHPCPICGGTGCKTYDLMLVRYLSGRDRDHWRRVHDRLNGRDQAGNGVAVLPPASESIAAMKKVKECPHRSRDEGCGCSGHRCALGKGRGASSPTATAWPASASGSRVEQLDLEHRGYLSSRSDAIPYAFTAAPPWGPCRPTGAGPSWRLLRISHTRAKSPGRQDRPHLPAVVLLDDPVRHPVAVALV